MAHVALLRAVNVGGHNKIAMPDLCRFFADQGFGGARSHGKHAYITYPAGIGRSKLTTARIEDALGSRGTGRNWNTVLKLSALCE